MKKTNFFKVIFMMMILAFAGGESKAQSQYHIGDGGNQTATNIKILPNDSGTIIAGYDYQVSGGVISSSNIILMRVNSAGTSIIWQEKFGIAGATNLVQNMIICHNGDILIVGTIGRNSVYQGNIAAIMRFSSVDGHVIAQYNMYDPNPLDIGGEVFLGVTELGDTANYNIVAVGVHDLAPHQNSSMICVFSQSLGLIYEEQYMVPWGGDPGSDIYYGVCTAADSLDVYIVGIVRGNYADTRVDEYRPNVSTHMGSYIWSHCYDFSLPGITQVNGIIQPGSLNLQDNFFQNVYLAGDSLIIQGGSLNNFTYTGGAGESINRLKADGTGTAELWQVQDSWQNYSNTSKLVVANVDHVYNVQMPWSSYIDPTIWLTGTNANSVISDISSLSGYTSGGNQFCTINNTMRFTTPESGIHSLLDIDLNRSQTSLELAGTTTDSLTFGGNDIYYVKTPTSLPSYTCNQQDTGIGLFVPIIQYDKAYNRDVFGPVQYILTVDSTYYQIAPLCANNCYNNANLTFSSTTDSNGNCVFTATASISTSNFIIGYQWTGAGAARIHHTHASTDTIDFILPLGATDNIGCTIYLIDTNFTDTLSGPCCQAYLTQSVTCTQNIKPCNCFNPQSSINAVFTGDDAAGANCLFNVTVIAGLNPGCQIKGYQWEIGGLSFPLISSGSMTNSQVVPVPYGTSVVITVTIYAINSSGQQCSYTLTETLNCDVNGNGSETPARDRGSLNANSIINAGTDISIFPNPTNDGLTLTATGTSINKVVVIDVNGSKVASYTFDNVQIANVSLGSLPPGTYLIRINDSIAKTVTRK